MTTASQVRLREEIRHNHPWIFQKMIAKSEGSVKPQNGSVVDILTHDGTWFARGIYNGHARVALRILTNNPDEQIDLEFFKAKFGEALRLRREVMRLDEVTDAYRLVHGEGDGLSGLVVDRFGKMLVLEFFSSGMYRLRPLIQKALQHHFPDAEFYFFAEEHVQKQESIDIRSPEAPAPFTITEHGKRFNVAPGSKHKTGFFVDQRSNRKLLGDLAPRFVQNNRLRVLDLCCNSGGFAINAVLAAAQAKIAQTEVTAIDLDETAIALAKSNAALNGVEEKIKFIQVDIFHWLREAHERKQLFDVIILDPAKLTRTKEELPKAVRKYADMNRLAMQVLRPGGLLLTCSCTGLVSETDFLDAIRKAAFQAGRHAQVIHISGADTDHPWMSHASEGRYLKAVWCKVL